MKTEPRPYINTTESLKDYHIPVFFIRAAMYVVLPPGAAL